MESRGRGGLFAAVKRRFEVSPEARADIAEIRAYLLEHASPAVAARVVARIRERLAEVRRLPLGGAPRPALGPDVRIAVSQRWVIYYDTPPGACRVLRVLDGSRDRHAALLGSPEVANGDEESI